MKHSKSFFLFVFLVVVAAGAYAQQQQQAIPNEVTVPKHVLSPGDVVKVSVLDEADLSDSFKIQKDGNIKHPLLGAVKIRGKTVEEATTIVRDSLKEYLYDPKVTITVTEYAPKTFTILGAVRSPGNYTYDGDQTVNIIQAIARAGGWAQFAKKKEINIMRTDGARSRIISVNVKDLEEGRGDLKIPLVQDHDIIYVDESNFRLGG